jgi:hypothetical protein
MRSIQSIKHSTAFTNFVPSASVSFSQLQRLFEKSEIDVFLRFFALIPAFSQREKEPETAKHLPSSPSGRGLR